MGRWGNGNITPCFRCLRIVVAKVTRNKAHVSKCKEEVDSSIELGATVDFRRGDAVVFLAVCRVAAIRDMGQQKG